MKRFIQLSTKNVYNIGILTVEKNVSFTDDLAKQIEKQLEIALEKSYNCSVKIVKNSFKFISATPIRGKVKISIGDNLEFPVIDNVIVFLNETFIYSQNEAGEVTMVV